MSGPHVKQHAIGDADNHSQSTLAELNALISDADLEDSSISVSINQVGHGFSDPTSAVNVVRHDGSSWIKAQADSPTNAESCWVVIDVEDSDNFTIQKSGTSIVFTSGTKHVITKEEVENYDFQDVRL